MKKLGNILIEVMQDLSRISTNGSAYVKVNNHICDPERFEQLFNYFSRGTILERLEIEVDSLETKMECACGFEEKVEEADHNGYDRCPSCGRFADIKQENYRLEKPNPERAGRRDSIRF
ncbi:MAG: hydrogenase/urease maturation nickel metallochaperone HypA [Candidatus Nanohaloarchaea archaeon]